MKISTRGRYALRMMIDLAQHYNEQYISLKDISSRQEISKKYLEQIIPLLNQKHLLKTAKGQRGGYRLSRDPETITLADIVSAAEGGLAIISCLEDEENQCEKSVGCVTLPIWTELNQLIIDYLSDITLQDILDKSSDSSDMYVI